MMMMIRFISKCVPGILGNDRLSRAATNMKLEPEIIFAIRVGLKKGKGTVVLHSYLQ